MRRPCPPKSAHAASSHSPGYAFRLRTPPWTTIARCKSRSLHEISGLAIRAIAVGIGHKGPVRAISRFSGHPSPLPMVRPLKSCRPRRRRLPGRRPRLRASLVTDRRCRRFNGRPPLPGQGPGPGYIGDTIPADKRKGGARPFPKAGDGPAARRRANLISKSGLPRNRYRLKSRKDSSTECG